MDIVGAKHLSPQAIEDIQGEKYFAPTRQKDNKK